MCLTDSKSWQVKISKLKLKPMETQPVLESRRHGRDFQSPREASVSSLLHSLAQAGSHAALAFILHIAQKMAETSTMWPQARL